MNKHGLQQMRSALLWSAVAVGTLILFITVAVLVAYARFLNYRHVGIFQEHRRYVIQELCGLVRSDARPSFIYWAPAGATDGYVYVLALPMDDAMARRLGHGGLSDLFPDRQECRRRSHLLSSLDWVPGPVFPAVGMDSQKEALGRAGILPQDSPRLHLLEGRYDAKYLSEVLLAPGGLYLRSHRKNSPHPFVYLNSDKKLVLVKLFYVEGFPAFF